MYEVSFLGDGSTSYDRAFDFAFLRAAEIALNRQAKSFILLDVVNLSSVRQYLSAPILYWTTAAGLNAGGQNRPPVAALLDWTERSYLVMEPAQDRTYYRPGVKLKVKLLPDPPGSYYPYDPAKEIKRLKRKYGIQEISLARSAFRHASKNGFESQVCEWQCVLFLDTSLWAQLHKPNRPYQLRKRHRKVTLATWETHESLTVAPLIRNQRCYGEATV